MKLLIMRHGEAGVHLVDAERQLTVRGVAQSENTVLQASNAGFVPDRLWCSTLVRARQTASIVAQQYHLPVEVIPGITPDDDPQRLLDALSDIADYQTVMVVSHMPLVGLVSGLLLNGLRGNLSFVTSQILALDVNFLAADGGTQLASFYPR